MRKELEKLGEVKVFYKMNGLDYTFLRRQRVDFETLPQK